MANSSLRTKLREEKLLARALALLTPGRWAREHGIEVPIDREWTVARIRLMRDAGMTELADHLLNDELDVLEAYDHSDGTTRANDLRKALA